jgi:hypothetical protein
MGSTYDHKANIKSITKIKRPTLCYTIHDLNIKSEMNIPKQPITNANLDDCIAIKDLSYTG